MWVRIVFLHHCPTAQLSAQLNVFLSDLLAAISADGYNLYTVDENKEVPYTCFLLLFYYFLHSNCNRLESTNKGVN